MSGLAYDADVRDFFNEYGYAVQVHDICNTYLKGLSGDVETAMEEYRNLEGPMYVALYGAPQDTPEGRAMLTQLVDVIAQMQRYQQP